MRCRRAWLYSFQVSSVGLRAYWVQRAVQASSASLQLRFMYGGALWTDCGIFLTVFVFGCCQEDVVQVDSRRLDDALSVTHE